MAHATVSRCLVRRGVFRMPATPREQVRRFEWPCTGALLQIDTKRLARFGRPGHRVTGDRHRIGAEKRSRVGWEFCHSIVGDYARIADTEIHADENVETVTAFVQRAVAFYASPGPKPSGCRPTTPGAVSRTARCAARSASATSSIAGSRPGRRSAMARSRPDPNLGAPACSVGRWAADQGTAAGRQEELRRAAEGRAHADDLRARSRRSRSRPHAERDGAETGRIVTCSALSGKWHARAGTAWERAGSPASRYTRRATRTPAS